MIVLELMSNGDLRNHLVKLRTKSVILPCLADWKRRRTTCLKEARSPSSGLPLRQSTTRSTRQAVTCGAMGWSCMRYGALDRNPSLTSLMLRR
ncbi:hypothetical protein GBAR_LOCUS14809 [Geodia barretti]|uniref:Uncharacterized protein n=1 Tax=Geodia barretti TaxID=519541 RepID=A0AA35S8Z0_GEOBA|nr:hypothetical protein GBAR_LOCUS14809 [Geodia barretti]